jgi:hypothetical protein
MKTASSTCCSQSGAQRIGWARFTRGSYVSCPVLQGSPIRNPHPSGHPAETPGPPPPPPPSTPPHPSRGRCISGARESRTPANPRALEEPWGCHRQWCGLPNARRAPRVCPMPNNRARAACGRGPCRYRAAARVTAAASKPKCRPLLCVWLQGPGGKLERGHRRRAWGLPGRPGGNHIHVRRREHQPQLRRGRAPHSRRGLEVGGASTARGRCGDLC